MSYPMKPVCVQPRVTGQNLEQAAGSRVLGVCGLDILTHKIPPLSNPATWPMATGLLSSLFHCVQAKVAHHAFTLLCLAYLLVIRRLVSVMNLF
jgi:hypothetical protein